MPGSMLMAILVLGLPIVLLSACQKQEEARGPMGEPTVLTGQAQVREAPAKEAKETPQHAAVSPMATPGWYRDLLTESESIGRSTVRGYW